MNALRVLTLFCAALPAAALTPTDPRCEYRVDPLGIGTAAPRLTWRLASDTPGARQSAYQILVATTLELLARDEGDLWDSGKVESAETALIPYAGAPLAARARCHWKVRVWDGDGTASDWSAPALWTVGLLSAADWSAQWIGHDAEDPDFEPQPAPPGATLEGAAWIWHAAGPEGVDQAAGRAWFRRVVEIADAPATATLAVTVDNTCKVYLNGEERKPAAGAVNAFNRIFTIDLGSLPPGRHVIAVEADNHGDAPNPAGLIARLELTHADGRVEAIVSGADWMASAKRGGTRWREAEFDAKDYAPARVVARLGEGPWNPQPDPGLHLPPPPYLRRDFALADGIVRATAHVTALGHYELRINGQRVGEDQLAPGWTDYAKRIPSHTYDVTDLVRAGDNAVAAILADGWYAGYIGFRLLLGHDRPRGYYGERPRLLAQLEIEYADGRVERVTTDGDWRAAYGAIREADQLMGEKRDLRREMPGWDVPGFDDSAWTPVVVSPAPEAPVEPHRGVPVRELATFTARGVKEVKPGVWVYDLGQNIVGWARVTVDGAAGQHVVVRHAEMLQEDGTLYTEALRKARSIDQYILAGTGRVRLEPAFTFHGFQYVEISGLDAPPAPEDVVGVVIGSAIDQTGHFESSNPILNQLFHNIVWGQRGNYLEIPTDCPQRDERLGWTGDAQFFMPTAAYTADIGAFFSKWLVDLIDDAQREDGSFPDIAPDIGLGAGNVAWGDAAIICTHEMYRYYGDTAVIAHHYDRLKKGMDFLEKTSENHIRKNIGYGDWLNLGGNAKDEVICTAYYAHLAGLMAEMGAAIGRDADAARFGKLRDDIRAAFIDTFVDAEGRILESSQTGYALAFTMDLLPEDRRAAAALRFEEEIARFDHHLATGFIGTPRLLPGLQAAGRLDLAYRLLLNTTFPSWLFQVTLGATTMWERWDGWTPDKGFQDPAMNSFNHYAFGAVGQFLYEAVGGIQPLAPGFRRVRVAPHPGGDLSHATVRYNSIRGEITSAWRIADGTLALEVTIPPNVEAEIGVPASDPAHVDATRAPHTTPSGTRDSAAWFTAGGGTHTFTAPW